MNPWGPIIAAMIAGFIAFIGMIITKENKVSEFRQAWINDFREEISYLIEAYKKWTLNNNLYQSHLGVSYLQWSMRYWLNHIEINRSGMSKHCQMQLMRWKDIRVE